MLEHTGPATSASCQSREGLGGQFNAREAKVCVHCGENHTVPSPWLIQVELLLENLEATVLVLGRYETPDVTALAVKSIAVVFYCSVTYFHQLCTFKRHPFIN